MDKIEKQTQAFLKQCVSDGRMSQEEYNSLRQGRESSGCVRPEWVVFPLKAHPLKEIAVRDCEIWLNYPAWALAELAAHEGMTISAVRASLRRVCGVMGCGVDPAARRGLPSLNHMIPLDAPNTKEPSISEAQRF